MNNKGFTLIELLAVIIVLAIVSSITVMAVNGSFSNAKVRSEKVFINNVTKAVDAYIAENMTSGWGADYAGNYVKYESAKNECDDVSTKCYVKVYRKSFKFQEVIDSGYLKEKEVVNPNNKEKNADGTDKACYDDSTEVKVYRDSDYVYCFMVKLGCLDKNGKAGVINTCPFKDTNSGLYTNNSNDYFTVDLKEDGSINTPSKITQDLADTPR